MAKEAAGRSMIDFQQTKADAVGRWPGILSHLGIDAGHGEHRPCPMCGGKDRFRFDDKEGRGTWFCNQCGAGDGVKLVMNAFSDDYATAMRRIASLVGHAVPAKPGKKSKRNPRRMLNDLWKSSVPLKGDDPVTKYLRSRLLVVPVNDVRFCRSCYESDTKSKMPAMVAMVRNPMGKPVSLHRTYLNGNAKAKIKSPKKLMPGIEKLAGCAIRLFDAEDTVGVAEGIETAIAARQLFDVPVWATVSSTILESFQPPEGIRRIIVFADNDPNYTGQLAAFKLAKRLLNKDYIADVEVPDSGDWADQLEQNGR
jgi:putative DNA primase/helicase